MPRRQHRTFRSAAAEIHPPPGSRPSAHLERRWGWALVGPALVVVVGLSILPIGRAIWTSLLQSSPLLPTKFTGIQNYLDVIGSGPFLDAWRTTLVFTAYTVVLTTVMALGSASLLNSAFLGSRFIKPIALLPWAVPAVIAGVMWRWMFNDSWGPINAVLYSFGIIHEYIPWLGSPALAFLSVGLAHSWALLPLATVFLLAALQTVPHQEYEAARIDGAGRLQAYWYVTLPNIRTALVIVVLYLTLMGLTAYDIVYTMTSGGPGTATTLISYFTWSIAFKELNFGQAAALATMIAAVALVLITGLLRAVPKGALDDSA